MERNKMDYRDMLGFSKKQPKKKEIDPDKYVEEIKYERNNLTKKDLFN